MTSAEHELQRARFAARFPRAVATMRAQAVAAVFASAARDKREAERLLLSALNLTLRDLQLLRGRP